MIKADLAQLNTSYADLILLHAPDNVDVQWKGLEQALAMNLTRSSEWMIMVVVGVCEWMSASNHETLLIC